ncbi:hypothetical protein BCV72DRAFT_295485 [Rhizopus microsporus var. microsporus]|uniref:Uncharacterized protein n=1 Tax=Rhizopus microsporus var. microsporus TaxID=86635 RepID=A0A1X0QW52_RHIZD|nr:hypothetical protein BCV72DRAFT_295485 [Rhizopus microsporus var. microsporus]
MPFINEVVLWETGDDVVYSLIDESEKKKTKKPDFMLGIEDRKRDAYFFYVKLKIPACKNIYQEENDYVKSLKLMKISLNDQATIRIKNPKSLGPLCEGILDIIQI